MLRTFTTVKIQRLRPGLNPQTWVPEASMLTTRPSKPSPRGLDVVVYGKKNALIIKLLSFSIVS